MMRVVVRPAQYAGGLAAVWVLLAWINDGTTFHLAPMLVALVVPLGVAMEPRRRPADLIPAAAFGALVALAATGILAVIGRLEGPSLLPFGTALTEAVLFSVAGSVIGLVMAGLTRRRR